MAFEYVSVQPRIQEFREKQAAFLADPVANAKPRCDLRVFLNSGLVKYVRPNGVSTGPGGGTANDDTNAWSLAEFITQQASITANTRVVFTGTFTGVSASITASNLLLDCRNAIITNGALVTGPTQASNGEWYITGAPVSSQAFTNITENGWKMQGFSATGAGVAARLVLNTVDTVNDWVTLETGYALQNGDKIGLLGGTLAGISTATLYYVVDAQTFGSSLQSVGLSLTEGGAKIDLTAVGSGNRYFFSDFSGRNYIPIAGKLSPGQFSFVPWLDRLYFKPTGRLDEATYYLAQTAGQTGFILTGTNTHILGGYFHTFARAGLIFEALSSGCGVYGATVSGAEDGIVMTGAPVNSVAYLCEVYSITSHGVGSTGVSDAERGMYLDSNYVHHVGVHPHDFGDNQGLITNPASNGSVFINNILSNISRPIPDITIIPTNTSVNCGVAVIDSSSNCVISHNYFYNCYGEHIEFGPNDTQTIANNKVHSNVFDMRTQEPSFGTVLRGVNILINSTGTFGVESSNFVYNNLFLLGPSFGQSTGSSQDSGIISIRIAATGATPARTLTFYNNVIVGNPLGYAPCVYMFKKTNNAYTHGSVVANNNLFSSNIPNLAIYIDSNPSAPGPWPHSQYTAYTTLAAWNTFSSQDAASTQKTDTELATYFDAAGRPKTALTGRFIGYEKDADKYPYRNPPNVGAYELPINRGT